jgi:hypothetical protein
MGGVALLNGGSVLRELSLRVERPGSANPELLRTFNFAKWD